MSEPIAVLALRRKRDLISGTIVRYEKLILAAQHDLAHVNSALRLFEVTGEAADLPPYVDLNRVRRRGETTAICMAALEKEEDQKNADLEAGGIHIVVAADPPKVSAVCAPK